MMSNWGGFSEEELRRLQTSQKSAKQPMGDVNALTSMKGGRKPGVDNSKPKPRHAVQPMKKQVTSIDKPSDVPSAALISASIPDQPAADSTPASMTTTPQSPPPSPAGMSAISPTSEESKQTVLLDEEDGRSRDMSSLQQYQQQQKMMEELNKKKKAMLSEALAQRQKQATVEAHKLNAIKKQLSALDQMLTQDVNVIRDKIEEATREYTEASKRYEQAEKEFVASKVNLHKKSELKEQLTEHLYTIIHQNELRKAKKLAELMEKLDLATAESEADQTLPSLPSYSLLGSMQTVGSGNLAQHTTNHNKLSPSAENAPTDLEPSNSSQQDAKVNISANGMQGETPADSDGKIEQRDEKENTADKL